MLSFSKIGVLRKWRTMFKMKKNMCLESCQTWMEDLLCPHKCVEYSLDTHVKKKKGEFCGGIKWKSKKAFCLMGQNTNMGEKGPLLLFDKIFYNIHCL